MEQQKVDLDALEAALAKKSEKPWGWADCVSACVANMPALIAELRDLRAESAAIKARAWQSIETAPKNGTGFLAWNESLRIVEASWWSDNMAGITHWQPFPDGPTHALPLPPAPEDQ